MHRSRGCSRARPSPLGHQQTLDQALRRREEHGVAALRQLVADGGCDVGLAATGQSEEQHVFGSRQEGPVAHPRYVAARMWAVPTIAGARHATNARLRSRGTSYLASWSRLRAGLADVLALVPLERLRRFGERKKLPAQVFQRVANFERGGEEKLAP